MNWLISILVLALLFFLVYRDLQGKELKHSRVVFTAFFIFSAAMLFLSFGYGGKILAIGDLMSSFVASIKEMI